jgi:hypothetical protein
MALGRRQPLGIFDAEVPLLKLLMQPYELHYCGVISASVLAEDYAGLS